MTNSAPASPKRTLPESPLLRAARGQVPAHPPVWFMRQAGRSLPEYRAVRAGTSMLQSCLTPELACEITMQPVRRHGVDAAILFSDIVVPLYAAGVDVDIVAGTGPVLSSPVRTRGDVATLPELTAEHVQPVADTIGLLTAELGQTPLIGFAGAPFTLASYMVEGGPSRNHERTKALMHAEPETWHALADRLADITLTFLRVQAEAGVDAMQLFDSWAGALSDREYREFVLPHSRKVLAAMAEYDIPRIHFGVGTGELLPSMHDAGADVIGVDFRVPLSSAVQRLRDHGWRDPVVQGNLDPAVLFAGAEVAGREALRVLDDGRSAAGHIVNLGHGVLPATDPGVLTSIVELIHAQSIEQ